MIPSSYGLVMSLAGDSSFVDRTRNLWNAGIGPLCKIVFSLQVFVCVCFFNLVIQLVVYVCAHFALAMVFSLLVL